MNNYQNQETINMSYVDPVNYVWFLEKFNANNYRKQKHTLYCISYTHQNFICYKIHIS